MKIYTGSGDRGKTSLFSGERVTKGHRRVEAYGDVDELSSVLGMLIAQTGEQEPDLHHEIQSIQSILFHAGAWLATDPASPRLDNIRGIDESHIRFLEAAIDRMQSDLPELTGFVLPGGDILASWSHIARTVCRRCERHVVTLQDSYPQGNDREQMEGIVMFLNRLSDYLFVLARHLNRVSGRGDMLWKKP